MGGERVPQQMRVDATGLEAGFLRELAQDQERSGAGQRPALGVQEELRPVAPVEERAPSGQVAAKRLRRRTPDGDDPLLVALADAANEPLVEVDAGPFEADRLADPEAGP